MKRKTIVFILFIIIFIFTGCHNYREIENVSIVPGIAIDKAPDGKYLLTVEIADFTAAGKDATVKSKLVQVEGDSIFNAVKNTIKIAGEDLFLSHTHSVIIGPEVAKEGILPIINWLMSDDEPRLTLYIIISREKQAQDFLKFKSETVKLSANEMAKIIEAKSNSKTPDIKLYQIVNEFENGNSLYLPVLNMTAQPENETFSLGGTALFKGDKLKGFLDENETELFLIINDQMKSKTFVCDVESGTKISLNILKVNTVIKPLLKDGNITMQIKTDIKADINGIDTSEDIINPEGEKKIESAAQEKLKTDITEFIKASQKKIDYDIFGFGSYVYMQKPKEWSKIKDSWDAIYKNMQVEVEVKVKILNAGEQRRPVKIGG